MNLGITCALLAPMAWSLAVILYRRCNAPPIATNFYKNTLALVLLLLTMAVLGIRWPSDRPLRDWMALIGSSLWGLSLADTLFFMGLSRVGAAKTALVDTTYAPTIVILSAIFLGERPAPMFGVGAFLVVSGLILATVRREAFSKTEDWGGMALVAAGVSSTAGAVILTKPVLNHSNLIEVTTTRLAFGVAGQLLWLLASGRWRSVFTTLQTPGVIKGLTPPAVTGTYVAMLLWLGGYKWADASVAAVLNQLATVYTLFLARTMLKEKLRWTQVAGAALSASGALLIILTRS